MRHQDRQSVGTYYSLFAADIGTGGVVAGPDGLLEVFLPFAGETGDALVAQIAARYPFATEESPLTRKAADLLATYFAGEPVAALSRDLPGAQAHRPRCSHRSVCAGVP